MFAILVYTCADISSIGKYLYSIAVVIFRDISALVLPPPILLASLCALGGLKEVNTGVRMRWYLSNSSITTRLSRPTMGKCGKRYTVKVYTVCSLQICCWRSFKV